MNIPQTGINKQKSAFFHEVAQAFEFLALFHSLTADDQLAVMQMLTKLQGQQK